MKFSLFFQALFLLRNCENVNLEVRRDLRVSSGTETNHVVDGVANQPEK